MPLGSDVHVLAGGGAGLLVLVVASALVATRRRTGRPEAGDALAAAREEEAAPLIGRGCEPALARGAPRTRPALLALALLLLAGALCARRLRGRATFVAPPAASACMTSDEALLRGAYDVPEVGGLGLPPSGTPMWPVQTSSARAQRLFDQGAMLLFGFNHAEALRNFEAATRADARCGMCWWAVAYANGPHVNMMTDLAHAMAARRALRAAHELEGELPPREAAYLRALQPRYPLNASGFTGSDGGQPARDLAFAEAMGALHAAQPDDAHAAALYAESLMTLHPWDYFERRPSQAYRPPASTLRPACATARRVLDGVLAASPDHPLALHLLVHLTESSDEPADAEPAARRLAAGRAGAANSHLVHMAGHTFLNLGAYPEAIAANALAVAVDDAYAARCLAPYFPGHQRAQLQAAAMLSARAGLALAYAAPASAVRPEEQAEWLQSLFPAARPLVRARFGQWAQLLGEDAAEDGPHMGSINSRAYTASIWSYGRALALANTGRRADAQAEAARLSEHVAAVPAKTALTGHVYDGCHSRLGSLMEHTVRAALALPHDLPAAIASMRAAAAAQDALPYMEPEHWYLQTRLCEGALLLRAGDGAAALRAFDEDLRQHNNSAWALLGRADALRALGDVGGAQGDQARLAAAMRDADVRLDGPCCELGMC